MFSSTKTFRYFFLSRTNFLQVNDMFLSCYRQMSTGQEPINKEVIQRTEDLVKIVSADGDLVCHASRLRS